MALDSTPVLMAKMRDLKLNGYVDLFIAHGWDTAANFAFAANYIPGSADEGPFINEVVVPILGSENHPLKPALRRLFFDCYTMLAADAQRRATG
eukprot:8322169-Karenia_brevis.AAC.1